MLDPWENRAEIRREQEAKSGLRQDVLSKQPKDKPISIGVGYPLFNPLTIPKK